MSIIFENETGYLISHKQYFDKYYKNVEGWNFTLNEKIFHIVSPYKNKKSKNKVCDPKSKSEIEQIFLTFIELLKANSHLVTNTSYDENRAALQMAEFCYHESGKALVQNSLGSNNGVAKFKEIGKFCFLFPENCEFYSKDVSEMSVHLQNRKFDFILLDPPWWNKYIRRKRKKSSDGYKMMYNSELKDVPVEQLLKDNGIVVVWCTNSSQNLHELINVIFPKWKIQLVAQWYWVKITLNGEPICDFSEPPGKQPYEKIILGSRLPLPHIKNGKLVVSVPSAIHSHKPPLIDLLRPYLQDKPTCLEIFARYLLPNFTSYGNEVLRLQHESLFTKSKV